MTSFGTRMRNSCFMPLQGPENLELFGKKDFAYKWWFWMLHIFQIFVWKSLENLYYRDKKFSIEVHDPKR